MRRWDAMRYPPFAVRSLGSLMLINLVFPLWRIYQYASQTGPSVDGRLVRLILHKPSIIISPTDQAYSYIGTDHPFYHPTFLLNPAVLNLQETLHYGYNSSDPSAELEWEKILDVPDGTGRTHLGGEHRSFLLTFYHQLHCVFELHSALIDRNDKWATPHHVNHCLQYLRQTLLCQGTDTLEEGDFMQRNYQSDRLGPELECHDWTEVYQELGMRYNVFLEWKQGTDTE